MVELLYDHFDRHADLWRPLLAEQCFISPRVDEYVVLGLVLQSLDLEAL